MLTVTAGKRNAFVEHCWIWLRIPRVSEFVKVISGALDCVYHRGANSTVLNHGCKSKLNRHNSFNDILPFVAVHLKHVGRVRLPHFNATTTFEIHSDARSRRGKCIHTIAFVIRINHKKADMEKKHNTKRKRDPNGKLHRNSSERNIVLSLRRTRINCGHAMGKKCYEKDAIF